MFAGFKIYVGLLFVLIGFQFVVAGENMVDFQRELKAYQKDRKPGQSEPEEVKKTQLKNPPIEISLKKEEEKEATKKE